MRLEAACALLLWACVQGATAQLTDPDPDWRELDAPPPPAVSSAHLLPLELPRYVSVKMGIDPASIQIGNDGIVRYVVVATAPSGKVSAIYEGIRCQTGEVKVYARHASSGDWDAEKNPEWQPLRGRQPSLHALAFAKQGACVGRSVSARSGAEIVGRMRHPTEDNH